MDLSLEWECPSKETDKQKQSEKSDPTGNNSVHFDHLKNSQIYRPTPPPPTSHPLSCIGNRSERLMHTQKCRAFTRVIAAHQLSKFKAGEMCPGVSLKKCKFHMPLLIWMQSDMTVAEFAQQRGNRYQVNTVYVHTDRRRKEVAAWIIHYETPHTSLMAGDEESSWSRSLFWDERSVCQQLERDPYFQNWHGSI